LRRNVKIFVKIFFYYGNYSYIYIIKLKEMKKITFLFLISFLLFSCEKPLDLINTDLEASEIAMPVDFTLTVTNVSAYDGTNGKISNDYQTVKDSKNTTSSKTVIITQSSGPELPPTPSTQSPSTQSSGPELPPTPSTQSNGPELPPTP